MKEEEIKETLAKQLQLLHERSKDARNMELVSLTDRMILLANYLENGSLSFGEDEIDHLFGKLRLVADSVARRAEEDEFSHRFGSSSRR